MSIGLLPFVLIPLLVYTYFWINPTAFAAFLEGFSRYIVEIYLGYKQWKLERETKKAFHYYRRQSEKLAKEDGLPKDVVKAYFSTYGEEDWKFIYQKQKEDYENRNRDLEDEMRELVFF